MVCDLETIYGGKLGSQWRDGGGERLALDGRLGDVWRGGGTNGNVALRAKMVYLLLYLLLYLDRMERRRLRWEGKGVCAWGGFGRVKDVG